VTDCWLKQSYYIDNEAMLMLPSIDAAMLVMQQSRTGAFRLVHFQILGAFALALGVAAIMVRMHPYPVSCCNSPMHLFHDL
jgi:hypothetical protein